MRELTSHRVTVAEKLFAELNDELSVCVEDHGDCSTYMISSDSEIFGNVLIQDEDSLDLNGATVESLLAIALDSIGETSPRASHHIQCALDALQQHIFTRIVEEGKKHDTTRSS
ncbi:MAG: hypothetical protein WC919_00770 [Candidatus Paceibacterota bacterium]|jgi:hypothetical protein